MLGVDESYRALRNAAGVYERSAEVVVLRGAEHVDLAAWLLTRSPEFTRPGQVSESLVLRDDASVDGIAVAVVDDDEITVVAETASSFGEIAKQETRRLGISANVEVVDHRLLAVEGPAAWKVVDGIVPEPIADVLLREWRDGELGGTSVRLARIGTTAEYGYVVIVPAGPADDTRDLLVSRSESIGGGSVDARALTRCRLEVNHPCLPDQADGLTVFEAGLQWLTGFATRDDDFRGRDSLTLERPSRRLVAAIVDGAEMPPAGTLVAAGGAGVGHVHITAAPAGSARGLGLLLVASDYSVPGLTLSAGDTTVNTVSRPVVDPVSWAVPLG